MAVPWPNTDCVIEFGFELVTDAWPASVDEVDVSDAMTDDGEAVEDEEADPPPLRVFVLVLSVCAATKPKRSAWKKSIWSCIFALSEGLFRVSEWRSFGELQCIALRR